MNIRLIFGFMIGSLIFGCKADRDFQWYRGNLHTHSYWSDGNDYPEQIMKWYKNNGYDFVALSDHNTLAEGEKWIEIRPETRNDTTFQKYLEAFGSQWVEYEDQDSLYRVRLKALEEYRPLFEEEGEFLIIQSEEISDGYQNKPVHINATNIQQLIEPQGGNSIVEVMQNNIDAVLQQRETTGEPMFPHINHPNFRWAITADDLKKLEGEHFFEVYNGHPLVHNYGDSLRSGTEKIWDEVITHYLLNDKPVIYGLSVDDAHNYHHFDSRRSNPGRGWIQVRSAGLSADSIIAAMERGDFYASTGIELRSISYDGKTLSIEIKPEEGVTYATQFIGTLRENPAQTGMLLTEISGTSASYTLTGNELYVRAKVISDKLKTNPYKEGEVEVAWIQPKVPRF